MGDEFLWSSRSHHFPAVFTGSRADVDDVVTFHHRFFIVFDDDQGVAQIAHLFEGADEFGVVALMQTD